MGGVIVGAGTAGMHYLGMWALEMPGNISWSTDLVMASILLAIAFAAAAMGIAVRGQDAAGTIAAAVLLTFAIISHHFTATAVLLETGLPPSRLELEITEGVLIDNFSHAVSTLRRLKALRLRIAMDDFGYSSLYYLQSFPFDKIKIDRSFISNLGSNSQSATIVRAVIGLARGLKLPVLAEGVETKEQLAFLAKEFCDQIQGDLIGRPLPIEDHAALTGQPRPARDGAAAS